MDWPLGYPTIATTRAGFRLTSRCGEGSDGGLSPGTGDLDLINPISIEPHPPQGRTVDLGITAVQTSPDEDLSACRKQRFHDQSRSSQSLTVGAILFYEGISPINSAPVRIEDTDIVGDQRRNRVVPAIVDRFDEHAQRPLTRILPP